MNLLVLDDLFGDDAAREADQHDDHHSEEEHIVSLSISHFGGLEEELGSGVQTLLEHFLRRDA